MLKVLIVEDDYMMADRLEETLVDAGFEVCGIAGTVADAIKLGEVHKPDLGVIDLRLSNGEFGTDVAVALRRRGNFGVLYATGNPEHPLLDQAVGEGCLTKPFLAASLVQALAIVATRVADRSFVPVSPRGFRLLNTA